MGAYEMKSGDINQFSHLSQFDSLKDFNNNIEMFLAEHKKDFTKGEYIAFMRLTKYCAKVKGIATCKIQTLVSACSETSGGISRSTIERMIRKAKKLGILTVYNTTRKSGGYAHNVFVFNRFDVAKNKKMTERETYKNSCNSKDEQSKKQEETNLPLETNNPDLNKRYEQLDSSYISNRVPKRFSELAKCYFNNAQTIEEYWKMAKVASYKNCMEDNYHYLLEVAIDSFKQMIRKSKLSKLVKPIAYFYSIAEKKFNELYYEGLFEMKYLLEGNEAF